MTRFAFCHHVTNYHTVGYLPKLGEAVYALRDYVRDFLFIKKTPCFRVLCPNPMMGMGQRRIEPSDDEASRTAVLWGPDPVHPTAAAYRVMADAIENDLQNPDSKYTNPATSQRVIKKSRPDPSLDRASWMLGRSFVTRLCTFWKRERTAKGRQLPCASLRIPATRPYRHQARLRLPGQTDGRLPARRPLQERERGELLVTYALSRSLLLLNLNV
jgi:hypothetical protein